MSDETIAEQTAMLRAHARASAAVLLELDRDGRLVGLVDALIRVADVIDQLDARIREGGP